MCDDREKLIAYLYDEADANERRLVDAHLAECAECRDELRGLRGVRQDLLSWAVPEHESVWKVFVAPQPTIWWRQVPAWGLAAAATLVFGIGLAGGVAARALAAAPVVASAQPQPATSQAAGATPEQVRALEDRLASIERVALARPEPVATSTVVLTRGELQRLLKETEGRISQDTTRKLLRSIAEMNKQRLWDFQSLTQQINDVQQRADGNLVKVLNRGSLEKEKEKSP